MGFSDDFYSLQRERRKRAVEKTIKELDAQLATDFEKEYYTKSAERAAREEIAPTKSAVTTSTSAKTASKKKEEDDGWDFFDAGLFEDGYDFGDITGTLFGTAADAVVSAGKGIVSMGEGIADLGLYGASGLADLLGADETASLLKKSAQRDTTEDLLGGTSDFLDQYSVLGRTSNSVFEGVGQVGAIMATGGIASAAGASSAAASAITMGTMGLSGMGSGMSEAYAGGATDEEAVAYGALAGAADALSEMLFGGLGKASKVLGIGKGLSAADDVLAKKVSNMFSNQIAKNFAEFGVKASAEGLEEVVAGTAQALAKKATYMSEEDLGEIFANENLLEQFVVGAVTSGFAQSGIVPGMKKGSLIESNKAGRDFITGYNQTEQSVIDKVLEQKIAEAEADGTKLTNKQKGDIEKKIQQALDKGDISIDTIEEVLGGDTYTKYRDTIASEDAQIKELENQIKELEGAQNTIGNAKKYDALTAQLEDLKNNSQRDQLRKQLDEVMRGYNLQDTRLVESYNERTRRSQAFEADVTKYDEKQQAVVQKAIDSGVLNNTRKTHEFVDLIAKIAADKGVSFNFANNARLKESGFALKDATINGYVNEAGDITLNVDSAKSLHSVTGHEVTHVLEGTELYEELQTAIEQYAKTKGEYDSRLAALTELYKGKKGYDTDFDTKVRAELTADLVGDYLFTDGDFVRHLSTKNRNLFQKIYDEIKYLCKIATAGSKEARELEKVKKAFEDAYRAETKNTAEDGGVKMSLSGQNKDGIEVYETSQATMELSWKERKDRYLDLMNNQYRGRTAKFERNGHTYYAQFDQSSLRKPIYGENRSSRNGLKAVIKAGADGDLFDLVENSRYTRSKKNTKDHTDADYFDYFVKTVQIDGKVFDLVADVEKKYGEDGGYVYTLALVDNKKIEASAALGTPNNGPVKNATDAFNDIVPQNPKKSSGKIQYSLTDNAGNQLSKGQQDYFKDSKMRDENGNLMVMYHGSQDAGFHIFDGKYSDDDVSFFFVDRNDVAASYSGTSETYEAKTIRTAEDMNNFLAEIGYDQYEAVERDGKFELLENGDHVAWSDTAQGIYEEFCWYEGVGEGDANYKVYLNLKNPLVVDAKGKNWNNVSREYSQEVADRYHSLTAEEKAALADVAGWEEYSIFRDELLSVAKAASEGKLDGNSRILASAYEKLGGANANLYDAFTIASDNFSEESIEQFAAKQMNTRDYAKKAKEQGYDGVIFKNIVDNGGYSNGSEGASTVAIAFDSKQIKSTANVNPTEDADIRYSLTEYTAEEKKAHNDAVRDYFGKTYMWAETGYLLLDGTKLDMSGKHEGAPGGYRTVDHRDIVDALGSDYGDGSYSGSLVQFMSEGNIRIIPEMGGINLSVQPTEAQENALAGYVQMHRGEVVLDIDDANGYTVASVEYPAGTPSSKVLGDIRAYFENGTKPEMSNPYSLTKQGEKTKTYGDYNVYGKDVALETAPVQDTVEDVAPVAETAKPITADDMISALWDAEFAVRGYDTNAEADATAEAAQEAFARIRDTDAPPEVDAPYYGESDQEKADDPFLNRDWDERTTKAFITDNPDAKPFFQEAAERLAEDFAYTMPAERGFSDELYYNSNGEKGFYGWSRKAADDINTLIDVYGLSYAQIADGLDAIIHDTPKVNNKPAKTIEFILNDRMLKGTKMWYSGEEIPPHQGYIDWLNGQKHADEFGESFAAITDADAPISEEIAPVADTLTVEDVMPIAEAPVAEKYTAIKPKAEKEPRMARATPAEQARAEIMTEEPAADKKKGGLWSKTKNGAIDKGMVFEDLSLATGNRELQARWNSIRYAEGKAQRLMGEGNASVKSLNSIREAVEKTGKTKQFYEYLYHQHNADRMTLAERFPDMENKPVFGDVTARESKAIIAELERKNPEFRQYAKDVYDYNSYLRQMLVDGGVISSDTAKLWEKMYPHYVPIRRLGDDGLNINVPLDTGRTGINAPVKRATGGNRDILPLFDTMGQRTIQTFKAIAKNRFGTELKNTLGTTIESDAVGVDDAIDSIDTQDGLLQEGKNGRKPTFTVFENGEKVTFEITDEMYDAMKPTNDFLAKTIKPLNAVSNFRRATLTEYNPWFMLKNAVKDVQDVLINSQHATRTYLAIPKAIAQMKTKGQWYQEYVANGGEQNTYFDNETNTFKEENKTVEAIKTITGLNAIQKANNVIEMLPRFAEYIASREMKRSVDVSMLDAARVTTNFAAGGDLTKFLNRNGATFLNASVQGAAQQVRNFREAKAEGLKGWAKLAGKFTIAGLPAVLLNGLIWDDDEEYEELSDYVKQNYYIVGKYGDGQFVRIPKGRTVAVIQNAVEQMQNAITGDDEVDLKTFVDLVVNNLAPNNPLENNIFSPLVQVAQNKTWYGEDLVPTRLQDVPAAEQYDESTDAISRWLGEATNTSPYKWNYLLDQYSGVIGDTFLPMLTPEAESGDNSFVGNMIAPLKDMFTTDSVMNNQNVSDFYDTVDELAVNANGSKATDEDVLKYKYVNSVNAEMGDLYKQKREIQNSDLPDDEKYEAVREIQRQIDEIAKDALDTYDSVSISGDYATVGDRQYRWYEPSEDSDAEAGWQKITDKQVAKQNKVTRKLGITPEKYWSNKEEYDYAYDNPEKYAIAKSVGGYKAYKGYSSDLYDIKADKDSSGKSISGSRKEKVADYINSLDADYGEKIILFKSEYTADDTYNREIVEYLDSRDDISWEEMKTILEELDFTVYDDGRITW